MCHAPMGRFQLELSIILPPTAQARRQKELQHLFKCRINDERPTGKKRTTVEWDEVEK